MERYLEKGYRCFLVRDVPQYALREEVEVVCDDGYCFGCVLEETKENQHYQRQQRHQPKTLDEMMGLGYSCVLTRLDLFQIKKIRNFSFFHI